MPTGYTAPIYQGEEITTAGYLTNCARAFGALIHMRDSGQAGIRMRDVSPYHKEQAEKAKERLKALQMMTPEAIKAGFEKENARVERARREAIQNKEGTAERYDAMIADVERWEPPTEDHIPLKEFAIKQLQESKDFDCRPVSDFFKGYESSDQWYAEKTASAVRDVEYHEREYAKEVKRVEESNEWIQALLDALPED